MYWLVSAASVVTGIVLTLFTAGILSAVGGAFISAGIGSIVNGYISESSGGTFEAGWIGGYVSGALTGFGAGVGGLFFNLATNVKNLFAIALFSLGTATSFFGGYYGSYYGSQITSKINGITSNVNEIKQDSIILGLFNIFAGVGAGTTNAVLDSGSGFSYKYLAFIVTMLTESIYDIISYFYGQIYKNKKYNTNVRNFLLRGI